MTTSYSLRLKPSAEKDLRKLPKDILARVVAEIDSLRSNPFPHPQAIKLANADRMFRIRVGDYRVIYEVETDAKEITVHHVRHRREAYRSL